MKKLVLIDGQSLLYKMYYGMTESTDGENANTCFCFLHSFLGLLEKQPSNIIVLFAKEKDSLPDGFKRQVKYTQNRLRDLNICFLEVEHVRQYIGGMLQQGMLAEETVVITGDSVLKQFVSDKVSLQLFSIVQRAEQWSLYDEKKIEETYGLKSAMLADVYALSGYRDEKMSGAQAIGFETACELIRNSESIEALLENTEVVKKEWIRNSLEEHKELVLKNKAYFTQVEKRTNMIETEMGSIDAALLENIKAMLLEMCGTQIKGAKPAREKISISPETVIVKSKNDMNAIFEEAKKTQKCALRLLVQEDVSGQMGSFDNGQMFLQIEEPKSMFALFFTFDGKKVFFIEESANLSVTDIEVGIQEVINTEGMVVSCFQEKDHYGVLVSEQKKTAKQLLNGLFDCNIAAYLLNPLISEYSIADIAKEYLDASVPKWSDLFGKADLNTAFTDKRTETIDFYAKETAALFEVQNVLQEQLQATKMDGLMNDLEMPLSYVLFDMEKEGILVKPDELKAYGDALSIRIKELEAIIYEQANEEFNINSPKQLGEILFEKMMLPGGKKTKTGYSTAADVLEKLAPEYPFVKNILEYRQLAKLKSTYAEGLGVYIGDDQRIHTHFNQTITATGRLSSTEPNLQNIPMRMELGRRIRKVFVPAKGCVFMDADYSQIELRVLAHMSNDKQLIEAYQMDEDIHRITASKVFHTPFEEVTDLQRRNAKAVNFGIVYGISSFGLSQDLSISTKEAKTYIDEYFKTYPGIKDFLDNTVEDTKQSGYCVSMFGRRRPVPELKSSNHMQRAFGERIAMNSPIQGTAADLIKMAMLHVYDALKIAGLKSKLILQIHDELLIETREDEIEKVKEILTREMKNVCDMAVRLEIDLHTGNDWYEAK